MKKIQVLLNNTSGGSAPHLRLIRMEKERGLTPAQIGRQIAAKIGTNHKTESALYGFFRRGERAISESRIAPLAEVLGVTPAQLHEINQLRSIESVRLDFDPDLLIEDYLIDLPVQVHTLKEFLSWLATQVSIGKSG